MSRRMSVMSLVSVVILGASAALGCGGTTCPAPAAPAEADVPAGPPDLLSIRLRDYEAEVCACKSLACATTAEEELQSWVEGHRDLVERAFGNALREIQTEVHLARVAACRDPLELAASPEERDAASSGGATAAIRKMSEIADEVCLCQDQPCLDRAMKKMSSLKEPSGKPTKQEMERAMQIAERMAECQKRILTQGMP